MRRFFLTILLCLQSGFAFAQEDWSGLQVSADLIGGGGGFASFQNLSGTGGQTTKLLLDGNEFVTVGCIAPELCPPGVDSAFSQIPITHFARSSTVAALQNDVSTLRNEVAAINATQSSREMMAKIGALAAVLDTRNPVNGQNHRVSFDVATVEDEEAYGASYVGRQGNFDFAVGYALTEEQSMGKASVGFSW